MIVCFGYQCKPSKQKHLCKTESLHQKILGLLPNVTVMWIDLNLLVILQWAFQASSFY